MRFTLFAPATGVAPFTLGFAFKQGDIPAGRFVTANLANCQITIKNAWPDGSAKIGMIAGRASLSAGIPTVFSLSSTTTPPAGTALTTTDLRNTGVSASTGCGTFGSVTWSGTDWDAPFQSWVSGAEMSSWIYRKKVGTDAHLVAWLEVRLFAGGAVEVLPWIENGYLNVAGPTNKSATFTFTLGNVQRFSQAIDLPNHCRTPLLSSTALSHWLGSDPGVTVKHDAAYLQATELVPSYFATVSPSAVAVTSLVSTFTPLQKGNLPSGMGDAGYKPSIGLLPEWDVLYLTSSATTVWAALQRNAYSAGRYGVHFRDETTNRPLRFSSYPTTVVGGGSSIDSSGSSSTSTYTPDATGTAPAGYFASHHHSMGFMAYLVTGRYYFLEEIQFVATANYLKSSSTPRENSAGVLQTWSANLTRGAAWGVRTLAQAACITPDDDTVLRNEFLASIEANINRQHATHVAQVNNPYGFMEPYADYTQTTVNTSGAGSTSTMIDLVSGVSNVTDYYVNWQVTIGGQTRTVTAFNGVTKVATVAPAFTVTTASVSYTLRDGVYFDACWMLDFYTAAIGYTKSLRLALSSGAKLKLDEFFAWKAMSVVGRFGGAGATEYLYRDAAVYTIAVAKSDAPDFRNGTGPWHANWGAVWADTMVEYGPRVKEIGDGSLRGTVEATAYWGNLQPALAYAVRHGVAGAQAAMNRMVSASNWPTLRSAFDVDPVWSVRPAVIP